jgi:hypothetical protein
MFLYADGNLKPEEDSTWMAEKEPHSTQCDSWARGAVAVKKKPKVKKGGRTFLLVGNKLTVNTPLSLS